MAEQTGRASIFGADDPIALFREWLAAASLTEPNDPNAIALATVDTAGLPNVRMVLLKAVEDGGFVFYTNFESAKGTEIAANARAAFVIHWKTLRRQIRVRGVVERVEDEKADAYYASRALDSRLGAWASRQSRPLDMREMLEAEVEAARDRFGETPPRPPHWGGLRIDPVEIEFWADGAFRLHDREIWTSTPPTREWYVKRLFP